MNRGEAPPDLLKFVLLSGKIILNLVVPLTGIVADVTELLLVGRRVIRHQRKLVSEVSESRVEGLKPDMDVRDSRDDGPHSVADQRSESEVRSNLDSP